MKKLKMIKLINYILVALIALTNIVLSFIFKFNLPQYYIFIASLIAVGIINLIFMAIKEATVMSYDSNKFEPIAHAGYIIVAVLCFYLVKYLNEYNKFFFLYWIGLLIGAIIPICITLALTITKKSKSAGKDKPKFIVNKK